MSEQEGTFLFSGEKEKAEWGRTAPFLRCLSARCRTFSREMKGEAAGQILVENEVRLRAEVKAAVRQIRGYHRLPMCRDGVPYSYGVAKGYLEAENGRISQKSLCEYLAACTKHHAFYDDELVLLSSFLVMAAVSLYTETKKDEYLGTILRLSDIDFESVYFEFSAVERIFLTEAAGVYVNCDVKTRRLYHARLHLLTERKGEDEIAAARAIAARANKAGTHLGAVLKPMRGVAPKLYFYFLTVMTLLMTGLYAIVSGAGWWNILLVLLAVVPLYSFVKEFLTPFFASVGEKTLPKLAGSAELDHAKTLVAVTTLLFGEEKDAAIFDRLEDFYLTNGGEAVCFAVLGDLPQSAKRTSDKDAAVISYAKTRIEALRAKYGDHFALFVRDRRRCVCENAYIGWERKRGGVLELCRFLRGGKTSIRTFLGDREFLSGVRYLVTLDADTNLYIGAVREMIGAMLHPENKPVIDSGRVVSGHAIIAPRMITSLDSASASPFARLSGGAGGLDIYAGTSSDLYQQVFDEGSFCGKGILDVDAFLTVCDGFFPNERILSHDLAEGNLMRSALGSDIVLSDSTPKNAMSYYTRMHRWLRGDLQVLPYLRRRVVNVTGEKIPNPMSRLSKFKIFDNVMRGATPLFALLAVLISFICGARTAAVTALFAFLYLISPVVMQFFTGLYYRNLGTAARRFYSVTLPHFLDTVAYAVFRAAAVVYEAYLFADAAVRTWYRFHVSHRNFLNWTTASEGDSRRRGGLDDYVLTMWVSIAVGAVFLCIPVGFAWVMGVLWAAFPFAMWVLSMEPRGGVNIAEKTREALVEYAHDAWLYFRDLVTEETNFLPPDNKQFSPVERTAMRTSPTNIGLYLLSVLAARDFDFIISAELCERTQNTMRTLSRMLVWNGHFYNWYDIRTLEVIGEPFISTVDSGNFITSLVAFSEGIKEYVDECPALLDVVGMAEKLIAAADFSVLYDACRRLFRIGYNVKTAKYSDSCYDTLMSESRTTSFYATATLAVPREHYFSMSRRVASCHGEIGVASWSGTAFEYFMPQLLLPTAKNSLADESLAFAYRMQTRARISKEALGRRRTVFGVSESGYFGFDYEMNYQYRAFGVERLALDPATGRGMVIAPYASFLMLERDPEQVAENLVTLRALGMYGKYGFYEAIDFDPERVGGGYAVIKSYMAHHLGMSIVAVANAVKDGVFRTRFMKNPVMRASRELLAEKIPVAARSVSRRKKQRLPEMPPRFYGAEEKTAPKYEYNLIYPEVSLVSNNKTKIIASSSGHVELTDGTDVLFGSDFERYALGGGLRVYANIDGAVFAAVPLSAEPEGFSGEFDFVMRSDMIEYRSVHTDGTRRYEFRVRLSVLPDREIAEINCFLSGGFRRAFVQLYFEPVMDKQERYAAHKSFSGLFIESSYDADDGVLVFGRRPRSDKKAAKLLGVTVTPSPERGFYDTMRDKLLPLAATERDFSETARMALSDSTGAVIVPACAMRSGLISTKKGKATFFIGYSTDADDLLYLLAKCRTESGGKDGAYAMGDILNLQYSAAGLRKSPAAWERYLLRGMFFGATHGAASGEKERSIDLNSFWRYSISGENKLVLARVTSDNEEQRSRLFDLIRLFKYMCIRGVRYDFVILYAENDHYSAPCRKRIEAMIRQAGCENFVAWTGGIFLIPCSELSPDELYAYEKMACAVFDLSVPIEVTVSANPRFVPISAETAALLGREPSTVVSGAAAPEKEVTGRVSGGFFYDNGFVCEKPHGRAPWAHIVASENFGTVLTENSLGFTYSRNAGMRKLTPHEADAMREDFGERLILRLYDRFDSEKYEDYDLAASAAYADYSFGAAEYSGQIAGIVYRMRVTLIGKFDLKRITVHLEAGSAEQTMVCLGYLVRPALGERRAAAALYRFREEFGVIHISRLTDGGMGSTGLAVMNKEADALYTDATAFACDGRLFSGMADIAAVCVHRTFSGSMETSFYLASYAFPHTFAYLRTLCFAENPPDEYRPSDGLQVLSVRTGNPLFDAFAGKWSLYQALYARVYARSGYYQVSGAFGFRDQLQDALALIPVLPQTAQALILRAAAHQYEDGSVQHWWHPGTGAGIMTRCSDDFLWLPYIAAEYVAMTGDTAILDKRIAYLHSAPLAAGEDERYEKALRTQTRETLFDHMLRAVKNGMRRGAHGLPLIGSCDWNDGMNLVGRGGRGESVWLAFFTALVFRRMAVLCRARGMDEFADSLEAEITALLSAVEKTSYDGAWYLRGFYDDGSPLGSHVREECKIDVLPQAFAMIASREFGTDRTRAETAMDSLYRYLYDEKHRLVRLLTPPFDHDEQSPGYIKGYVPGIRENGGQYTHAAVWAALGFFAGDDNARGAELLFAVSPAMRCENEEIAQRYQIEPYVLAGDVYTNPAHVGRGGWSWYTGSAAWYRKVALEVLCGYTEEDGGFSLNPHLSERFRSFTLSVSKKDTTYHITVSAAEKDELTLDGTPIADVTHRFLFDGAHHEVMLKRKIRK